MMHLYRSMRLTNMLEDIAEDMAEEMAEDMARHPRQGRRAAW